MLFQVCLVALAGLTVAQYQQGDPRNAAILTDSRYLNGDGKFGASYTQEDGVQFKEESDPDGTRRGTYSYVDPSGQRKTVSYTAGKHGFLASGDHLPVGPASIPQYTPDPRYNPPAEPEYRPAPQQYNPPPQQYNPPPQPQYNPPPQQVYRPQPQPQPAYRPQPQPQQVYRPQPQPAYNPPQSQPVYRPAPTTPAPHRFFPPGKLSLNRSPDGYSYTFNKS
uniref:Putative cuticular protein n=1 Tax=Rhodnius prolixus TaxID=13249 RepID=R4FN96_RHOPR